MKNLFFLILLGVITITSCKDETQTEQPEPVDTTLEGEITENKTLTSDEIWKISGRVVVTEGVTLTIEPGTIIKSDAGTGSNASVLIIARGGKLNANGTATNPIIMTSTSDNIELGETQGTNLTENDRGLWGGLIILGKAPGSFESNGTEIQIEGIPASDTNGLYGGTIADDNSGTITYVSIRHGGTELSPDNEINGLTLGCVGSGTTINHIEIVGNLDDGIEFFGGTVNVSDLLVWAQVDDGLDVDQGYSGTISNSMVILGSDSDHALEIDGPEGDAIGQFTLNNITIIGNLETSKGEYADFRSHAMGTINNVFAKGFKDDSDVELDNDGVATNYNNGDLVFGIWEIVLPSAVANVSDIFINKADNVVVTGFGDNATSVTDGAETVGADVSDFTWTFAHANAAF